MFRNVMLLCVVGMVAACGGSGSDNASGSAAAPTMAELAGTWQFTDAPLASPMRNADQATLPRSRMGSSPGLVRRFSVTGLLRLP